MKRSATLPHVTLRQNASASPATFRRSAGLTVVPGFGLKAAVRSASPLQTQQTIMCMVVSMTCAPTPALYGWRDVGTGH